VQPFLPQQRAERVVFHSLSREHHALNRAGF
jgi:hypothetical protein